MKRLLGTAVLTALAGCAPSSVTALDQAQRACDAGAPHIEVTLSGYVARVQGIHQSRSGAHEGFIFATPSCSPQRRPCAAADIQVEDNVDIGGRVPLHRGEAITLRGQYECDDGVIHWTHSDPRGRHLNGYIEVNGTRYQ